MIRVHCHMTLKMLVQLKTKNLGTIKPVLFVNVRCASWTNMDYICICEWLCYYLFSDLKLKMLKYFKTIFNTTFFLKAKYFVFQETMMLFKKSRQYFLGHLVLGILYGDKYVASRPGLVNLLTILNLNVEISLKER